VLCDRRPLRDRAAGRDPRMWLFEPLRWSAAFDTFLWPFLGFLLTPLTTLMYVAVYPAGINGFDYFWLGLGS
jgi:hypothetical protein